MEPIWWILIQNEQIGPLTYLELEKEDRLTPDTYVWREGMQEWQRARAVPELKKLFEDQSTNKTDEDDEEEDLPPADDELTIAVKSQPPYFLVWFVLIIAILLYVWYLYG